MGLRCGSRCEIGRLCLLQVPVSAHARAGQSLTYPCSVLLPPLRAPHIDRCWPGVLNPFFLRLFSIPNCITIGAPGRVGGDTSAPTAAIRSRRVGGAGRRGREGRPTNPDSSGERRGVSRRIGARIASDECAPAALLG